MKKLIMFLFTSIALILLAFQLSAFKQIKPAEDDVTIQFICCDGESACGNGGMIFLNARGVDDSTCTGHEWLKK
ncbi:MAG: hypothetical protein LAT68_16755 [Cyclobacteriaceae bacterium]|nr:hypothetical protein [Cyclobacteriaceae bacterium]MCH8517952.1 hypothetical protein [Cyclobacteriaceae bacterium]